MYAYDAKSDRSEESEQKFDKSIGERVKLTRQKTDYQQMKKIMMKNQTL